MRKLEEWFGEELVVVGVHAGKFIAERETANIREAVLRLGVEHPVVNDRQFRTWRAYAVNAWPTLTLLNPEGRIVGQQAGEIPADLLAQVIERVIVESDERGTLDRTPLRFPIETPPEGPLAYPAGILADGAGERLFVSDTGHHRVLVVRLNADGRGGEVEAVIGGAPGFADGSFGDARLRGPHGLELDGDRLYIADTGNNAVRVADLSAGRLETVAGTGELAETLGRGGRATEVPLRSPWGLAWHEDALLIGMAGSHQIWRLDLASGEIAPWAGTGAEALVDGPLDQAALSQPSGLASDGRRLFFADSEDSGIRWADLAPGGNVHTIVGTGLFDFGDRDGIGDEARLQHPLDVAWHDDKVYVADTYNGKIKIIDPETREVRSWLGDQGELWEPGALSIANDRVYIADTNHHRIMTAELGNDRLEEVEIRGLG